MATLSDIEDIQEAIRQLSADGQALILSWLRHSAAEEGARAAEPSAVYGERVKRNLMSIQEYLEFEESAPTRHEYVAGEIFAMSGGSIEHELIAGNVFSALRAHLRGAPCKSFIGNFKLHLHINDSKLFYYPDVMVACGPIADFRFCTAPKLIIEVLSPSSESTDRREKSSNYRQIPTLQEYVLIAQRKVEVTIYRRTNHWSAQILSTLEEAAEFHSLETSLPLAQIYEDAFE